MIKITAYDNVINIHQTGKPYTISIDCDEMTDFDTGVLIEALMQIQEQDTHESESLEKTITKAVEEKPMPANTKPVKVLHESKVYICATWHKTKQIVITAIIDLDKTELIQRAFKASEAFYSGLPVSVLEYSTILLMIEDGWKVLENKEMIKNRQPRA